MACPQSIFLNPQNSHQVEKGSAGIIRLDLYGKEFCKKSDFNKSGEILRSKNIASKICNNLVSQRFIANAEKIREEIDYVILLYTYTNSNDKDAVLDGFVTLIKDDENESLYVDVICARPVTDLKPAHYKTRSWDSDFFDTIKSYVSPLGKLLLNYVTCLANEMGYKYIKLSALAYVINYYRKLGWKHGKESEPAEITELANEFMRTKFKNDTMAAAQILLESNFIDIDFDALKNEETSNEARRLILENLERASQNALKQINMLDEEEELNTTKEKHEMAMDHFYSMIENPIEYFSNPIFFKLIKKLNDYNLNHAMHLNEQLENQIKQKRTSFDLLYKNGVLDEGFTMYRKVSVNDSVNVIGNLQVVKIFDDEENMEHNRNNNLLSEPPRLSIQNTPSPQKQLSMVNRRNINNQTRNRQMRNRQMRNNRTRNRSTPRESQKRQRNNRQTVRQSHNRQTLKKKKFR